MEPSLRPASPADIPDLLRMMADFYAIDGYPFDGDKTRQNLETFIADESLGRIWLILQGDSVIGYIVLSYGFSFEYGGKNVLLDEFYLEADHRNRGIGQKVMQLVETEAANSGVKTIHLEVEAHNAKGRRIYEKRGYASNKRMLLFRRL